MTDEARAGEPRTEAGREFLSWATERWGWPAIQRAKKAIRAIEAQAASLDEARLAGRLFGLYGDHVSNPIRHDWEADARRLLELTDD